MEIASNDGAAEAPLKRLTRVQFWGIFAIGVTIFLFATGPVWRKPWQFDALNLAILYSYIPLPFLVVIALAYKKRFTWRAFFLDTLAITLLKYSVTFAIALCLWSAAPPPPSEPAPHAARAIPGAPPKPADPLPAPTPIDPAQTGAIEGAVVDRGGAPLGSALVYVAGGLEKFVFAAPETPLVLENDGTGFRPRLAAAMLHQPIVARASDRHLHTLLAVKDGVAALNVPLLSSGGDAEVVFQEAHGVLELHCRVHQHAGDGGPAEETATLGVFAHPFFAITGPDGRFSWAGVPAGQIRVGAWVPGRGGVFREVDLAPRGKAEVRIEVAGP